MVTLHFMALDVGAHASDSVLATDERHTEEKD